MGFLNIYKYFLIDRHKCNITRRTKPLLKSIKMMGALISSSLGLGFGKPNPYNLWKDRPVGAWLAVPQTQRGGVESLDYLSRRRLIQPELISV